MDRYQWEALNQFVEDFPDADMYRQLRDFWVAYGYEAEALGTSGWTVSIACNNTFSNHGCTPEEVAVNYANYVSYDTDGAEIGFSPVLVRRSELAGSLAITTHDIKAGDEILSHYAEFQKRNAWR